MLAWGWEQKEKILFLPDQHLGRNTAYFRMGVPLDQMVVWDPKLPFGGLTREQVEAARLILWKGHCSVHVRFTAKQIAGGAREHPGVRVIVHPGSAVRGGGGRRRQRLDRVHPVAGAGRCTRLGLGGRAPRSTWCTASPPRWRRRA